MRIEQLGPPDADHSTGLILCWRDQLLFAVESHDHWRERADGTLARFVGIGGHVEPGEIWAEAVRREALEEASLEVTLLSSEATYFIREDGTVEDVSATLEWPASPRPCFIWSTIYRFGPPARERVRHFVNVVFLATAPGDAEPYPAAEVPAIIAVSEAQLRQAAVCPVSLGHLLADGATVWESAPVLRSTLMTPGGSAQWCAVLLEHQAS